MLKYRCAGTKTARWGGDEVAWTLLHDLQAALAHFSEDERLHGEGLSLLHDLLMQTAGPWVAGCAMMAQIPYLRFSQF